MFRRLMMLAFTVIALAGCGGDGNGGDRAAEKKDAKTAKEIYADLAEARRDLETTEEKLAVTKNFLSEYPESEVTARALDAVLYYQGEALGDLEGAITYAEGLRDRVTNAEILTAVDKVMIPWYGQAGKKEKMLSVADRLAAANALGFNDHWNVIEAAGDADDWELVRAYCEKARPVATAEAYRADYPNGEFTEDEVAQAADNRLGMILVMEGWARANQGEIDAALDELAKADGLVRHSYVGTADYDLDTYRARTLMMARDFEKAIDQFAREALVMGNAEALTGMKEAYAALHGDTVGFTDYAATLHRSVAKTVQDFQLSDYEEKPRRFSNLRGDVTLLAFWFPT
jgi:hypothetical protein